VSTGAFGNFAAASWANYLITFAEKTAGDYWQVASMPANVAVGWYDLNIYNGTAIGSTLICTLYGYWDGTNFHLDAANVKEVAGTAVTMVTEVDSNVTKWLGTAAATPAVAGVPKVELDTTSAATVAKLEDMIEVIP
jgi:hypothetical protein